MTRRIKFTVIISFIISISLIVSVFSYVLYSREQYYRELLQNSNNETVLAQQEYNNAMDTLKETQNQLDLTDSLLTEKSMELASEMERREYFEAKYHSALYFNSLDEDLFSAVKDQNSSNRYGSFPQSVYTVKVGEPLKITGTYASNAFRGYFDDGLGLITYYNYYTSSGKFELYFLSSETGLYTIGINGSDSPNKLRVLVIVYE